MIALFLISPAYGHLNCSFPVARRLQADGYTIVYGHFGAHELAQQIKQQGFNLHWMHTVPFAVGLDELFHEGKRESYLETLLDRLTKRTFHARTAELASTVASLKPSLILLDVFMSTDFISLYPLLKERKTPVFMLQTMLSTYDDGLTPPLNSALVPGIASAKAIRKAWEQQYIRRRLNNLRQQLTYFGQSRLSMIQWAFRRNGLPNTHRILIDKVFHVGFDNVPEWIVAPHAFDFPERQLRPFQQHIDRVADLERVEDLSPAYQILIDRIGQERQTNPAIKLIYVSLGTAQQAKKQGAEERFFNRLIDTARTQPNWRAILSVRPELVNNFRACPPNVFVFARVPQLHILQRADVFITHGGLNSVLEAILHRVPMLVYPLNTKWDLPGNAARVVAHGVGLMGNLVRDDAATMTLHIEQLLTDTAYANALTLLSERLLISSATESKNNLQISSPLNS